MPRVAREISGQLEVGVVGELVFFGETGELVSGFGSVLVVPFTAWRPQPIVHVWPEGLLHTLL